ncbi:MAG: two-component system cell cycle response regulator [Gammaproteobacteria bacterium]|jgi:two-component system cell cycle response regulator
MRSAGQKPSIILVVESARSNTAITKILSPLFEITSFESAEECWDILKNNHGFNILICELSKAVDHFGLIERIRGSSNNAYAALPVLLLLGEKSTDQDREEAFKRGATDFINIPFTSSELTTRVRLHTQLFLNNMGAASHLLPKVPAVEALQQLYSENRFISRLNTEMSFSTRHHNYFSVAKLKVDNTKILKGKFGKPTQLHAIKKVAGLIQATVRLEDTAGYIGNGEFHVLYPGTNGIGATIAIKRIMQEIRMKPIKIENKKYNLTVSAGLISCLGKDNIDASFVLNQADKRLQEAIQQGGNQIISFEQSNKKTFLSIDSALQMIDNDNLENLAPYIIESAIRTLPLLETTDRLNNLGISDLVDQLREKLSQVND